MAERPDIPYIELLRYVADKVGRTAKFTETGEGLLVAKPISDGRTALIAVENEIGQIYPFPELGGTPVIGHIRVVEGKIRHHLLTTDKRVFRIVFSRDNNPGGTVVEKSFLGPEEQRKLLDDLQS